MAPNRMARLVLHPSPDDWADDEPMTLKEAVAVFCPHGPLTVSSLRTEIANGRRATAKVAGRYYVIRADWTH